MSIILDNNTKIIVQGITGRDGSFHAKRMNDFSGKVVGGVTPGKGGLTVHGLPVFDSVKLAVSEAGANTSVIFVPGKHAASAVDEAISGGIKTIIVITEGVPIHDMIKLFAKAKENGIRIIGPNTPGLLVPDKILAGIIPPTIMKKGNIGLVSRSGTLTYQIASDITKSGFGISTAIGVGGDQIVGTSLSEVVTLFESDDETSAIVMVGEIGGNEEQRVAELVKSGIIKKPIVAFIAGRNSPPEKRMGHAGAIISGKGMSANEKIDILKSAGARVALLPWDVPVLLKEII